MAATSGWHVLLAGQWKPYPLSTQLLIEAAWWRGEQSVSITVGSDSFTVQFSGGSNGTQIGSSNERPVRRINAAAGGASSSDEALDHPLLAAARHVAELNDAERVLEYVAPLMHACVALQDLRQRLEAARHAWLSATKQLQLLKGLNVAVAGTVGVLGSQGALHDLIAQSGGVVQKISSPAKVNGNTDILVLGIEAEGGARCAGTEAAKEAARAINLKRRQVIGSKAKRRDDIQVVDEAQLIEKLSQGAGSEGSFPWLAMQFVRARDAVRQRHMLLSLALESAAWRAVEAAQPLRGLNVCLTGVMHLAGEAHDTHMTLGAIVRQCGGSVASAVAQSTTDVLVVGRGEKGEGGKPNGKGERAETSAKYTEAVAYNEALDAAAKPPIFILYEDDFLSFLLSDAASARVEASEGRSKRSAPSTRNTTAAPYHKPDARAIRFTSVAQQAHAKGEPGAKGGVLADALAAPDGFTLRAALVAAQSIAPMFVWTMLQTASAADHAPPELAAEVIMLQWGEDREHRPLQSGAAATRCHASLPAAEPGAAKESAPEHPAVVDHAATADLARARGSSWVESNWLGSRTLAAGSVRGTCELIDGGNPRLDELVAKRAKPRIRVAHMLTADTTLAGGGRMHSKFFVLTFAAVDGGGGERVRLVVSSANAQAGSYGGMPDHRELSGLWWSDFDVHEGTQPPSPFRDTLLDHVERLLASKPRHGAGSAANREAAEVLWRKMRATWERADTAQADGVGTTLISHAPGVFPLDAERGAACSAGRGGASSSGERVPMGIVALRECFRQALKAPDERLDLAVIAHCSSGWSSGGDGALRFQEWCADAAPNGGQVAFFWPRRGDVATLGKERTQPSRVGVSDCAVPEWVKELPLMELVLREDVIARSTRSGYQATPHLMLYVLHEPLQPGKPPSVRRMLLTSANLSAAPWGYVRDGNVEIRSFELGVCVAPETPAELVEPLGVDFEGGRPPWSVWAQAIPFRIERRERCADPFVSRALVTREGKAEKGHLNY